MEVFTHSDRLVIRLNTTSVPSYYVELLRKASGKPVYIEMQLPAWTDDDEKGPA